MSQVKRVSTALPILSAFTLYITAPFAHKGIEEGLSKMETAVYGSSERKQNTNVGFVFAGLVVLSLILIFILSLFLGNNGVNDIVLMVLTGVQAIGVSGTLLWCYISAGKQQKRILRLANSLDVEVTYLKGFPQFGCAFIGTWLFWIILGMFIITLVLSYGPCVRQYRTVKMYNELVEEFNHQR